MDDQYPPLYTKRLLKAEGLKGGKGMGCKGKGPT